MNIWLVLSLLMLGCSVGVVAMFLAIMSKSDERETYEGISTLERGRALR